MDISDEIEVEDELRDATIALPFQSLFDNVSLSMTTKILAKHCAPH